MIYTSEKLIKSIKGRTLAPNSQQTFQDPDLLLLANEELELKLTADILSVREDYFLRKVYAPIADGVDRYPVPERAIGNALKKIFYVDASGSRRGLSRATVDSLVDYDGGSGEPVEFLIEGDEIVLLPAPSLANGASLEIHFLSRPSELVATSSVGVIVGMNEIGPDIIFDVTGDLTSIVLPGGLVDFLNSQSPFILWAQDVVVSAISGTQVTVAASSVKNAAGSIMPGIGDTICPAQTANVPMVPQEFHPVLSQMTVCRVLDALGDAQKLQSANGELSEMRRQAFKLISNRVESELSHVVKRGGFLAAMRGPFARGR